MMAQLRKNMFPQQAQQSQGVSAAGLGNQQIGSPGGQNQFANARSIQPGSGIQGASGLSAAQKSGQGAGGGDQLDAFKSQLASGQVKGLQQNGGPSALPYFATKSWQA